MIYLKATKIRYIPFSVSYLYRKRRRKHKQWLRRHELYTRGITNFKRRRPSIFAPSFKKVPIVAYGRMWGYEDRPILIKRRSLWLYFYKNSRIGAAQLLYKYWLKHKKPRRNPLQVFMRSVVHFFDKRQVETKISWEKRRQVYFARQDFWYQVLRGERGWKHRRQVVDWPVAGFVPSDGIGLSDDGRLLHWVRSVQPQFSNKARFFMYQKVIPSMKSYFKRIRRGRIRYGWYLLRPGSRYFRERRDNVRGIRDLRTHLPTEPSPTDIRVRTEQSFYKRPWYDRNSLVQYIENYPEYKPFYGPVDDYNVGYHRYRTWRGGDCIKRYWDGTVRDLRPLPFPAIDRYRFDLDPTHHFGIDMHGGRSRWQKRYDRAFKRVSTRWLINYVVEELFMDYLEDEFSDQLWEDSEIMYCQDDDGVWIEDLDEIAGYDVDEEFEADIMYRHIVVGVAIRRFYRKGMKWMRLPYGKKKFIRNLQVAYVSYLIFLTSTFIFFIYLANDFINATVFVIFALFLMFW